MNINNKNKDGINNNNNNNNDNGKNKFITINHFHYYSGKNNNNKNKNKRNNRRNNKKNNNDLLNKKNNSEKTVIESKDEINEKSHIIIRSTTNPNNMKIVPISNNYNPFASPFNSNNLLKFIFEDFDKKKEDQAVDQAVDQKEETVLINENIPFVELNNINNLDDLINAGDQFDINDKRKYPINMVNLKNINSTLKELKNVIGMENVKKNIFEQLLFILQDLNDSNMMHTVIEGPPGVGKTLLGKILAKIYYKLNFLKKSDENKDEKNLNDVTNQLIALLHPEIAQNKKTDEKKDEYKFKIVRRSDLIGQYVGSTAIKTQKVIDEAAGGVLFIDEVYSLGSGGNSDRTDSFAKEAIDTLNQNLSENGDKFICIIAGYPDEIERCFFAQNEGLKRRFPFKYSIDKYSAKELTHIFDFKVHEIKWSFDDSIKLDEVEKFIEKNKKSFEHFGGDIENLLLNIKIKHSNRVFGKNPNIRKKINMDDIRNAFEEFQRVRKEKVKELPQHVKDMFL